MDVVKNEYVMENLEKFTGEFVFESMNENGMFIS